MTLDVQIYYDKKTTLHLVEPGRRGRGPAAPAGDSSPALLRSSVLPLRSPIHTNIYFTSKKCLQYFFTYQPCREKHLQKNVIDFLA